MMGTKLSMKLTKIPNSLTLLGSVLKKKKKKKINSPSPIQSKKSFIDHKVYYQHFQFQPLVQIHSFSNSAEQPTFLIYTPENVKIFKNLFRSRELVVCKELFFSDFILLNPLFAILPRQNL